MLDILYHDTHLVAVHKPAGLLVHRSQVDVHASENCMSLLRDQIGQWVYPVHRLDRPVSGVLLFALDPDTARRMGAAFLAQETQKTYLALVRGHCTEEGVIDYPLKEELDEATDAMANPSPQAKSALTRYTCLSKIEIPKPVGRYPSARYSLMALHPVTGRKHQLRRHMKHIFHPIVGDTTHGDGHHNRFFRDQLKSNSLMLAATRLEFPHPLTGERVRIQTRPDAALIRTLAKIGVSAEAHLIPQGFSDKTRAPVTKAIPWL